MRIGYFCTFILCGACVNFAFADSDNVNASFINKHAYIQDAYISLPSEGGTQIVTESQIAKQNVAERWFADGTWNVLGSAVAQYYSDTSGKAIPNYGYGVDVFGQTGQVAGFSVGGMMSVANPYFSEALNGTNVNSALFMPASKQVAASEAFVEYQYKNIVQADIGLLSVTSSLSPWLTQVYYGGYITPGTNCQGILVNAYPGAGWLLTALAFNGTQKISETNFNHLTYYNQSYNPSSLFINSGESSISDYTLAVGANYAAWNNNYNLRLWAYDFQNYGDLLYGDTNIKFHPTKILSFNIAAQGGVDRANFYATNNAFTNNNQGQISSNFVGIQAGLVLSWFSLNIGYNNVWGPAGTFGNGGIVAPYTYGFATDPLYTTPVMNGLIEMGSGGSAYKINPSFNLLDGNLSITPGFSKFFTNNAWNGDAEYDLIANYSVPQIKGLNFFLEYGYMSFPSSSTLASGSIIMFQTGYLY